MCPTFNWVSSFADATSLADPNAIFDGTGIESNTEISLRQFDFNGAASGEFFYHCEVRNENLKHECL